MVHLGPPMPKTTMDEYHDTVFAHHDVGSAWQTATVFTVAIPMGEKIPADDHLRFRIFAMYMRHTTMTCLFIENIHK